MPKIAYASVQQPFGCDPPLVHCPICGQASMKLDDEGMGTVTPCQHLAFIYVGAAGEYEYQSDDFAKRLAAAEESDTDPSEELLLTLGYGDSLLALEISYGGMGCGPMFFTDVFGFDYGTLSADEES